MRVGEYRIFVRTLVATGTNFHPDTPFADYVTNRGGKSFKGERLKALEAMRLDALKTLKDRVYDIGLEEMQRVMGATPE